MKKWRDIIVMMLAMVMVVSTPMSVLAENEEVVVVDVEAVQEVVEEVPVVKEVPVVNETPATTEETEVEENIEADVTDEENIVEEVVEADVNEAAPVMLTVDEENTITQRTSATLVSTQNATVTASYAMFKVSESAKVNTYSDGSMTAEIIYPGTSFLKMYLGTAEAAGTATEGIYEAELLSDGTYKYTVPIESLDEAFNAAVLSSKGSWKDNTLTISLVKDSETDEPDDPETGDQTIPADGKYTLDVTSSASMFKVVDCVLTVKDQAMTAVITLSGTGYDKLFMGTAEEAANAAEENVISYVANTDGKYTFEIPVEALDIGIAVAAHSVKNDNWLDRNLTFESSTLQEYVNIPSDGEYTIDVTSSASMFKVVDCALTVKDQVMTAVITLSGTGYDKLFMGTAEDAANAAEENVISYVANADGKYTFTIPVKSLDTGIAVAAHSVKNDNWLDRTLTFESSTLKSASDDDSNNNQGNNNQDDSQTNTGVTDDEAIKDMINNTTKGEVKDGTYTPSFGYKGGTGKTTLSCSKVVVKNGKATATIVFSSSSYTYMKVNGTKYYNTNKGGNSTFVVPVKLNGATTVYAETTAMSEAHEIEYTLYIYVDGTNVSNIKPATQAKGESSADEEDAEDAEALAVDAEEEENSWGAFGSDQKTKTTEEASAESGVAATSTSVALPAVIVAVVAVVVVAAVVMKKKSHKAE